MSSQPTLIAIDWGTSNFRAFLTDGSADILDAHEAGCGMMHVNSGEFPSVLEAQIGNWLVKYPEVPIIMSGMVGARQGWVEANYLTCPVKLSELVGSLTRVEFSSIHPTYIVPGLAVNNNESADVMRGEETQLFGALAIARQPCQLFCLPGTHSKWVEVVDGVVEDFRTYMTGEMFELLRCHSILAKQMNGQQQDWGAFERALQKAEVPASLLNDLFSIRAEMLLGRLPAASTQDYLTGLLIGYEIMQSADLWDDAGTIALIASESIAPHYQRAFEYYDLSVEVINPAAATIAGLIAIAASAGIIDSH